MTNLLQYFFQVKSYGLSFRDVFYSLKVRLKVHILYEIIKKTLQHLVLFLTKISEKLSSIGKI